MAARSRRASAYHIICLPTTDDVHDASEGLLTIAPSSNIVFVFRSADNEMSPQGCGAQMAGL